MKNLTTMLFDRRTSSLLATRMGYPVALFLRKGMTKQ